MPECHRCHRILASAELRRTTLGHLCLDNGPGSRCWTITRNLRAPHRLAELESERLSRGQGASA